MSADIKPAEPRLKLRGDKSLPRELVVTLRTGDLFAQVFALKSHPDFRSIAFTYQPLRECRVDLKDNREYTLWVGFAGFDLTAAEAAEIHSTFAPLGLRSQFVP